MFVQCPGNRMRAGPAGPFGLDIIRVGATSVSHCKNRAPVPHYSPVNDTYCVVPELSVTANVPTLTVPSYSQLTVIVQLAPGAKAPQLLVCVDRPEVLTELTAVGVLKGLVTVTVPC